MRSFFLHFLVIIQYSCVLHASGQESTSITDKESTEVRRALESFDKGTLSLDKAAPNSPEWCRKEIAYYFSHTNDVSAKMKLPISRCFVALDNYPEAAKLAAEYVNVYSNDWRGWSMLGGCKFAMQSYNEAVAAMTNAVRLGDEKNYTGLGMAALKADRMDVLKEIVVPHLLILKRSKPTQGIDPLDVAMVLALYSVKADEQDIFTKALDGVSANQIISRADLKQLVVAGCEKFKGKDIDEIRQELEAAPGTNSSSSSITTNAPSP